MTDTLRMNGALGTTRLDRSVQGLIGKPLDRWEGALKVSGRAPYAVENRVAADVAYAFIVTSDFAAGTVDAVLTDEASLMPGVLAVIADEAVMPASSAQSSDRKPEQPGRTVLHWGQPVAVVVADTYEAARAAAARVEVRHTPAPARIDPGAEEVHAKPASSNFMFKAQAVHGDIDAAMADAAVTVDGTYTTPGQIHAAMEPHGSIAWWDGDELTIHSASQIVAGARSQLAKALGIPDTKVRLISRFIGGGFGSKLGIGVDAVLAAHAARVVGRPVKLAMTRQQLFGATTRRTETIQHMRLAAGRDGKLTGIGHDSTVFNMPGDGFWEPVGLATQSLYAAPNRHVTHRMAEVNLLQSGSMRAPGEAVGMLGIENAMDELAEKLGLDPVELRILNEPDRDPEGGRPFSSRNLIGCLREGARRFGWDARRPAATRREGDWWIGMGMASAARNNYLSNASARVTLRPGGALRVETDMTDIGTGTYSILAQIAGEMIGIPYADVEVVLGDSRAPPSPGSGGSWGAGSAGSAVHVACDVLIGLIAKGLDVDPDELTLKDGHAIAGNRAVPLSDLAGEEGLQAEGTIKPGMAMMTHFQCSYGAHFAEVAVNAVTAEVRVRRMLGVFSAGRILNEKTARSQCIGGMVFGIGTALTEELALDTRHGLFVNHDLAEYHLPVNADVPQIEVHFLAERDDYANPLKSKGIGELGISGSGAAITNAIYNACGVRVRDYPATLDKILPHLPRP